MRLLELLKSKLISTQISDEEIYIFVKEEIEGGFIREGLMVKALSEAGGDKNKANANYIRLRAEALRKELPFIIQNAEKTRKYATILENQFKNRSQQKQIIRKLEENKIERKKIEKELIPIVNSEKRLMVLSVFSVLTLTIVTFVFGNFLNITDNFIKIVLIILVLLAGIIIGRTLPFIIPSKRGDAIKGQILRDKIRALEEGYENDSKILEKLRKDYKLIIKKLDKFQ